MYVGPDGLVAALAEEKDRIRPLQHGEVRPFARSLGETSNAGFDLATVGKPPPEPESDPEKPAGQPDLRTVPHDVAGVR